MSDIINKKIKIGDSVSIKFTVKKSEHEDPEIDGMTVDELEAYKVELEEKIDRMDANEPVDEESDEFEEWAAQHEDLEDLLDEVEDRLDELQGW